MHTLIVIAISTFLVLLELFVTALILAPGWVLRHLRAAVVGPLSRARGLRGRLRLRGVRSAQASRDLPRSPPAPPAARDV